MATHSNELYSVRHRIDLLRASNLRLREDLDRESSRAQRLTNRDRNAEQLPADLRRKVQELTPRELQVLRCIAEGHSTKEAGERLGIACKTAACHRHRLMQKLEVHSASSLVRIAIAAGVVKV